MQVLTIVEDNHVVGVTYGMVEIPNKTITHIYNKKYQTTKNKIGNAQRAYRTKSK